MIPRMNHAAALALVVWYLMQAPLATPSIDAPLFGVAADITAPLARWSKVTTFATRQECETYRIAVQQCVASNDARLKK